MGIGLLDRVLVTKCPSCMASTDCILGKRHWNLKTSPAVDGVSSSVPKMMLIEMMFAVHRCSIFILAVIAVYSLLFFSTFNSL